MSEPHRIYLQGEARLKEGDFNAARKTWSNLIDVFENVPTERTWVAKARKSLAKLDDEVKREDRWNTVKPALEKATRLAAEGNRKDAVKIWEALKALYRDDPFAQDFVKEAERGLTGK